MGAHTYYNGYLRINGCKEMLSLVDDKYVFLVYSKNHMYKTITETKCFDEDGVYLGIYRNEENFNIEETRECSANLSVTQIDYDFKLLPVGRCVTIEEVGDCEKLLKDCFSINPKIGYNERVNLAEYIYAYNESKSKTIYYKENYERFEICAKGHSSVVINKNVDLFELDLANYTKNKNNFIKKHPEYKNEVEKLYELNIGYLCLFWGVNKKTLLRNKFNKSKKIFDKLNKLLINKN